MFHTIVTVAFYRYSQTPFLSLMNYASDHFGFILSCVFRGSPLVRAVAHHALKIARYNSVIGLNALFCCARYGWMAADLLAGKIDVSNSYFQKICDNSLSTPCLKKPDMPIMSHNSSKNRTVSIIFDISNCPSTLDTLP